MKIIVSITLLLAIGNAYTFTLDPADVDVIIQQPEFLKCLAQTRFNPAEIDKGIPDEPSEEMVCFMKCMGEASGAINPDGSVNPDKGNVMAHRASQLSKEAVDEMKKCTSKVVVKSCQDVMKVMECIPDPTT